MHFQAFCGMYGFGEGTLATIETAEEQAFLERELKARFREFTYLYVL